DGRAGAGALPAGDGGAHVVRPARRDAEPRDIDQQLLRRLAEIRRHPARALQARRELLRDGGIRAQARNYFSNRGITLAAVQPSSTPIASATMSATSNDRYPSQRCTNSSAMPMAMKPAA